MGELWAGLLGTVIGGLIAFAVAPQVFVTLERYNRDQERMEGVIEGFSKKLDRLLERGGC